MNPQRTATHLLVMRLSAAALDHRGERPWRRSSWWLLHVAFCASIKMKMCAVCVMCDAGRGRCFVFVLVVGFCLFWSLVFEMHSHH